MTDATNFIPGAPCWIDVSTPDPAGSREFYANLLGWTYRIDPDPQTGHYTHALLGGRPVAGLGGIAAEPQQPVVWTVYLASADIAHTAAAIEQHGGALLYGPVEVPGQGHMLIGADPTGCQTGFWQPTISWIFRYEEAGAFCLAELNTWYGTAADEFFARLFGYRQQQIGDAGRLDYTSWTLGGQTSLGRLQLGPEYPAETAPHWLPHFAIDPESGIDAETYRAVKLGGQVRVDPYDSGLGRASVIDDPFGATFALLDASRVSRTEGGTAGVDDPYDD
ncbi:MAG: VOC family protein [Pseudonocardiaceae bacterium]|nr:VOC family protein [Pseudonocardiaceae bacterium]